MSGHHTLLGAAGPPDHPSAGDYARVTTPRPQGAGGAIYQQYNVPVYSGTGTLYTHTKHSNTSPPPYGEYYK